jgi:hypothetical protein
MPTPREDASSMSGMRNAAGISRRRLFSASLRLCALCLAAKLALSVLSLLSVFSSEVPGTFMPVFLLRIELVVEIDQVIIEVVVEIIIVVVLIIFIILVVFVEVIVIIQIVFIIEEIVIVVIILVVGIIVDDLVFRIVTVGRTCRSVALVYREPHARVAIFLEFIRRRLDFVQHTITFLRVREAPARVSLRVTASCDHSR